MLLRDLEQNIVKVINESGMSIDGVYFVMKSLMQEVENQYFSLCKEEDMQKATENVKKEMKNKENTEIKDLASED